MSSRTARAPLALTFAFLVALGGPLAVAAHEPHAHSPNAPAAAQAPAKAELAPQAPASEAAPAASGCCAMAAAAPKVEAPKCAACAAEGHGDHATMAGHDHAAMMAHGHTAMAAGSCCQGGDAAECCAGCEHCRKAENGGCCGHEAEGAACCAAHADMAKGAMAEGSGCAMGDHGSCCGDCPHCAQAKAAGEKQVFACPMHPEMTSDAAGKCSECGMKLEAKAATDETPKS